jgi:hypothetical protein
MSLIKFNGYEYLFLLITLFLNILVVIFLVVFFIDIFQIKDNFYEKKIKKELNKLSYYDDKKSTDYNFEKFLHGFLLDFYYKNNKIEATYKNKKNKVGEFGKHHFLPGLQGTDKLSDKNKSDKIINALPNIVATLAVLTTFNIFINLKQDIVKTKYKESYRLIYKFSEFYQSKRDKLCQKIIMK